MTLIRFLFFGCRKKTYRRVPIRCDSVSKHENCDKCTISLMAALCVCCVWFAFASRTLEMCLEWKSYCTIVSNIHDANASFLYIFYSVGCFASSSLHDAAAFQCSILWLVRLVVVSFEYLTVFFRFVNSFSWAVIIDAVQFTSYAVHTDVCSLSLSRSEKS